MRFAVGVFWVSCQTICVGGALLGTSSLVIQNPGGPPQTVICSTPTCNGSFTLFGAATATYSASGLAQYGILGSFTSVSTNQAVVGDPSLVPLGVINDSWFVDTFTFNGTGTCGGVPCQLTGPGTIAFQVQVEGTQQNSGAGTGAAYGVVVNTGNNEGVKVSNLFFASSEVVSTQFPITFGQAETFTIILVTESTITNFSAAQSVEADYINTAILNGFEVMDANGNPVNSFTVTSGSGTVYPDATLPEPSTFLTVALAIPFLAWRRKRA
jgi:hypothetical protein